MNAASRLKIVGLSELDLLDIEEELPEGSVQQQRQETIQNAEHGDLGLTAAVVILSAAAIHGLSVWLAKRTEKESAVEDVSVKQGKDGSLELTIHRESHGHISDAPDPSIVKAFQTHLSKILDSAIAG
jgi:hypothetical protein